jgi:hypothetical protein
VQRASTTPEQTVIDATGESMHTRIRSAGALREVADAGIRHAQTVLADEQLAAVEEGLETVRSREDALSAIVQRNLHSNNVVHQILASLHRNAVDLELARDVLSTEFRQLADDAKTTIETLEESRIAEVLRQVGENVPRFGSVMPERPGLRKILSPPRFTSEAGAGEPLQSERAG